MEQIFCAAEEGDAATLDKAGEVAERDGEAMECVDPGGGRFHEGYRLLWETYADPAFAAVLELLLADHRTIRIRPDVGGEHYDAALFNVKYPRHARFKGLVRAVVVFSRMRLRAAQAVYAPGGTGFAAAAPRQRPAARARRAP